MNAMSMVQMSMVQMSMVQMSMVQMSMVQMSMVQMSMVQMSMVQISVPKSRIVLACDFGVVFIYACLNWEKFCNIDDTDKFTLFNG